MTVGANHMLGCGFVGSAVTMGSAVGSAVGAAVGSVVGSVVGAAVVWQTLVLCLFLALKLGAGRRTRVTGPVGHLFQNDLNAGGDGRA